MRLEKAEFTLNKEELDILGFGLYHSMKESICSHYKHLQNSDNDRKRCVFFKQEEIKLNILKQVGNFLGYNLYDNLICELNKEIPESEVK